MTRAARTSWGIGLAGSALDQEAKPVVRVARHVDWLHHRARVAGPAGALSLFRDAAQGPGFVPWELDLDRMEEDWLHRLMAPPRRVTLDGARALAGQMRRALAARHQASADAARHGRGCPFDLQALSPVPPGLLGLGPDHPRSLAWLRRHWGAVEPLRRVSEAADRPPLEDGLSSFRLSFWSADWTPWPAFRDAAAAWPDLVFEVRPVYDQAISFAPPGSRG